MNSVKCFLITWGLLILANACSSPVSNSAVPAIKEKEVVPVPQNIEESCHQFIEKDFARIYSDKDEPATITNIDWARTKKNFAEGIDIEIKNVSDKKISSLSIDVSPQPNCRELFLLALPVLEISAEINPSETFLYHLSIEPSIGYFKTVKCKNTIPNQSPKPSVSVSNVKFSDGSTWKSRNNCASDDEVKP